MQSNMKHTIRVCIHKGQDWNTEYGPQFMDHHSGVHIWKALTLKYTMFDQSV